MYQTVQNNIKQLRCKVASLFNVSLKRKKLLELRLKMSFLSFKHFVYIIANVNFAI